MNNLLKQNNELGYQILHQINCGGIRVTEDTLFKKIKGLDANVFRNILEHGLNRFVIYRYGYYQLTSTGIKELGSYERERRDEEDRKLFGPNVAKPKKAELKPVIVNPRTTSDHANLLNIVGNAYMVEQLVSKNDYCLIAKGYGIDMVTRDIHKYSGQIHNLNSYQANYYITRYPITPGQYNFSDGQGIDNRVVYRNCLIATVLQQYKAGEKFVSKIPNQAGWSKEFTGLIDNTINFETKSIQLGKQKEPILYNTLKEYIDILNGKGAKTTSKPFVLREYIHKQVQLAFHPVIDEIQSEVKYNDLYYDGRPLIIAGGPGTGKTTTMVGRLKYLTDAEAIKEDLQYQVKFKLSKARTSEILSRIQNNTDWCFFSPSPLLCDYLAHAMEAEKMGNSRQKTNNWSTYREKMTYQYSIVDKKQKKPLYYLNSDNRILYKDDFQILQDFIKYYLAQFSKLYSRLPKIELQEYEWSSIALAIASKLQELGNVNSTQELAQRLHLIEYNYGKQCKAYLRTYSEENKKCVNAIINKLTFDAREDIIDLYESLSEDNEDEQENEQEQAQEILLDDDKIIEQTITKWLNAFVEYNAKRTRELKGTNVELSKILEPLLDESILSKMTRLAEGNILRKFAIYAQGPVRIMTQRVPRIYNSFRKEQLKAQSPNWNLNLLNQLTTETPNGLHGQEQALLLGFANQLAKDLIQAKEENGLYIDQYKAFARPVIGIDEVADFSIIEVYAMTSFGLDGMSAYILAGDLLQRMTGQGIKRWDDLDCILPKKIVKYLQTSYRQSKNLLGVAQSIYQDIMHEEAPYHAYLSEERVPKALGYVNTSEKAKMDWMVERIKELYKAYNNELPSIAIFLNEKKDVAPFANKMAEYAFFVENRIKVIDGTDGLAFGQSDQIRIFPIEIVKGMEFDAVFFHNMDESKLSEDLLRSYLYVGVSRASFFLGATFCKDDEYIGKYFTYNEDWKQK